MKQVNSDTERIKEEAARRKSGKQDSSQLAESNTKSILDVQKRIREQQKVQNKTVVEKKTEQLSEFAAMQAELFSKMATENKQKLNKMKKKVKKWQKKGAHTRTVICLLLYVCKIIYFTRHASRGVV